MKVLKAMSYDSEIKDYPSYGITEAARVVGMPQSTLRSWCTEDINGEPLFSPSTLRPPVSLSFNNLIEARVLRILRVTHGVRLDAVREAIAVAQQKIDVQRLLLHRGLLVDGKSLVLEHYGQLINLNRSTQLTIFHLLHEHMERIDWGEDSLAQRFYPSYPGELERRFVYIDPAVSFGNSLVSKRCITTNVLYARFNAGESIENLMDDYKLKRNEIESAIVYEEAA